MEDDEKRAEIRFKYTPKNKNGEPPRPVKYLSRPEAVQLRLGKAGKPGMGIMEYPGVMNFYERAKKEGLKDPDLKYLITRYYTYREEVEFGVPVMLGAALDIAIGERDSKLLEAQKNDPEGNHKLGKITRKTIESKVRMLEDF